MVKLTEQNQINEKLISGLKAGEKGAFKEIFNIYGPRIFRFAIVYLKNKPDAEELTQDVFLKLWEKRCNINPVLNFKAYIFKIAVNSIYDYIRKRNIEKAFSDFLQYNYQPGVESSWDDVIWNDMISRLNTLVNSMPEQRKIIFCLSTKEGLTNQQIADKLNLSKRTVENQLYRATQYLKGSLINNNALLLFFLFLFL